MLQSAAFSLKTADASGVAALLSSANPPAAEGFAQLLDLGIAAPEASAAAPGTMLAIPAATPEITVDTGDTGNLAEPDGKNLPLGLPEGIEPTGPQEAPIAAPVVALPADFDMQRSARATTSAAIAVAQSFTRPTPRHDAGHDVPAAPPDVARKAAAAPRAANEAVGVDHAEPASPETPTAEPSSPLAEQAVAGPADSIAQSPTPAPPEKTSTAAPLIVAMSPAEPTGPHGDASAHAAPFRSLPSRGPAPAVGMARSSLPSIPALVNPIGEGLPTAATANGGPVVSAQVPPALPSASLVLPVNTVLVTAENAPEALPQLPAATPPPATPPPVTPPSATPSITVGPAPTGEAKAEPARIEPSSVEPESSEAVRAGSGQVPANADAPRPAPAAVPSPAPSIGPEPRVGSAAPVQASLRPVAETPHDFATLVDRLTEAREAASPHAVRATIAHDQFGPVSMRLRVEGTGLSVSMTSADPDFAPAVQAAALVASQSPGANQQGRQPAPQDNPGQNQNQNQNQYQAQQSASANTQTGAQAGTQADTQARGGGSQAREERAETHRGQPRSDTEKQTRSAAEQKAGRRGLYA
ncbi:MAG TPA: hypothetical protein VJM34_04900 [Novosphingobium sp.]|nr:hypothetical protein [Novosphingobium sp.]